MSAVVVICFHFTIFVVLETTYFFHGQTALLLWFAFILLSLSYWKQPDRWGGAPCRSCDLLSFYYLCRTGNNNSLIVSNMYLVVICFHFTIFVVLETTRRFHAIQPIQLWFAFILLSLSYWKQPWLITATRSFGCDLLSFYYLCRTGNNGYSGCYAQSLLWFAFILLSLSYWKQLSTYSISSIISCDLLSFYYLCRTGNNKAAILLS